MTPAEGEAWKALALAHEVWHEARGRRPRDKAVVDRASSAVEAARASCNALLMTGRALAPEGPGETFNCRHDLVPGPEDEGAAAPRGSSLCEASGCPKAAEPGGAFCGACWARVPGHLKERLADAWPYRASAAAPGSTWARALGACREAVERRRG